MNEAAQGKTALSSGDYSSALSHYTKAISQNPQAVDYYIQRSIAYTRLAPPDHQAALEDANIALVLANKRGKRELIASAQLRRAIGYYGLDRWADSKQCLEWVKSYGKEEKTLVIWEMKADSRLKGLGEEDPRAQVSVKEIPDDVQLPETGKGKGREPTNGSSAIVPQPAPSRPSQTPAEKIRTDWYQTSDTVTVSLMARGIPQDRAQVKIDESHVEISFPLTSGSDYDFTLDPLYSKIDPAASSYKIFSTKAEFTLKKATPGVKWESLEQTGPPPSTLSNESNTSTNDAQIRSHQPVSAAPAYPTSSKSGPKDWDKLAADLTTRAKKSKTEKSTDDASNDPNAEDEDDMGVDDEYEGDAVNGFFQKLFKDADPNTKRAMMKSYQESNGTALSTNWDEVKQKTVETSPPEGMVAKKWGT